MHVSPFTLGSGGGRYLSSSTKHSNFPSIESSLPISEMVGAKPFESRWRLMKRNTSS